MEWKEVTLGEIAIFKTGKLNSNAAISNGEYPFFTCSPETLRINNYAFDQEAILLAGNNADGNFSIKYYKGKFNAYQRTYVITPIRGKVDIKFLYYALSLCLKQFKNMSQGTSTKFLTVKILNSFSVQLPSISDQHRIASILSSLDWKIELNNKINADLEEMAQAIFKNWFVDFEPFKDGKFVNSELGMIPEGWKVGTLADIAEITMGQSPAGNSLNENREGLIFYQGSSDFGFRFPSIRVFTTEPKRLAVANSVLFSVRAPVGDINVAKEECCIGRGVASIKSKYGHDSYLFYTMKSLHKLFDSFDGEGTVFGSINKKTLSAIQILLPSDGIVEQFNNIASSFDDRIRSLSDENSRLSLLRDTLLPRLMSGELEVPE